MKKIICLLMSCLLMVGLAACAQSVEPTVTEDIVGAPTEDVVEAPTTENTEPVEENPVESEPVDSVDTSVVYYIYHPNDDVNGLDLFVIDTDELTYERLLEAWKMAGQFNEEIKINSFEIVDNVIVVDFNQAFGDLICSMGSSGEAMVVNSVVNTFVDTYQTSAFRFTVEGEVLESGHVVYDFDLNFYEDVQ